MIPKKRIWKMFEGGKERIEGIDGRRMTTYLAVDVGLLVLLVDWRSDRVGTRFVGGVCGGWWKRHYGSNLAVDKSTLSWVCELGMRSRGSGARREGRELWKRRDAPVQVYIL